ncbi:MAG: glycosyltransferase family 4 protein [Verrucomicrobia bacterium]|nr:glycosyltransferase family 4 protein [Verrucomicrobiota bacterium]
MNVAIPISRFDSSGGIRVLTVLANGLAARDYNVSFVVPRGRHSPFFPLDPGVNVHIVGSDAGDSLLGGLIKKVQLAFGLPPRVDVAIANAFMTAYSVRFSKAIGRCDRGLYFVQHYEPLAFGAYGQGSAWLKKVRTIAARLTYHLRVECVTNSRWTAQMLREQHSVNSMIAPLGVDTGIFHPDSVKCEPGNAQPFVMAIGNSNPIKRFDLFAATARALNKRLSSRFLVASHSPTLFRVDDLDLEATASRNDYELADLYRRASCFVSTSAMEGFGLPLLEAMACGTPVVTTDSGGIRDFCKDRYNCLIVTSDRPEDLAAAIEEVHANKELRERLIRSGLDTAKEWPWHRLIDAFDACLKGQYAEGHR